MCRLGNLRFYPKLLQRNEIEEIYLYGSSLGDISTGSKPENVEEEVWQLGTSTTHAKITEVKTLMETSVSAEVLHVVQAAQKHTQGLHSQGDGAGASPAMPAGDTRAESWSEGASEHVKTVDADLAQRRHHKIVSGPYRLSKVHGSEVRYLTHVPSFFGTGMTLSWWYRHMPCAAGAKRCGLYFLHAGDFVSFGGSNDLCWSAWIENGAFWYDEPVNGGYRKFEDWGMPNKFHFHSHKIWRHMALQFNEASDHLLLFIDGNKVFESAWGGGTNTISRADCQGLGKKWALGHSHPGDTYSGEAEIADMVMYLHNDAGAKLGPLAPEEIRTLSNVPAEGSPRQGLTCIARSNPAFFDSDWRDVFGNSCAWYYTASKKYPEVCSLEDVERECPVACRSMQECFSPENAEEPNKYFVYNRAMKIGYACMITHTTWMRAHFASVSAYSYSM